MGTSTLFSSTCGLYCASTSGAKVINCSWGYYADKLENASIMYDALKKLDNQGIILLASAGNDNILVDTPNIHIPSSFTSSTLPQEFKTLDNVVSVASTNVNGIASSFTNYSNQYVDIAAIGEDIESNGLCGTQAIKSGTSMATPVITAAIADYTYCIGQNNTPKDIIEKIYNQCAYETPDLPSTTGSALLYHFCQIQLNRNSGISPKSNTIDENEFKAYPNPFVDQFNIDISSAAKENATIEIHDFLGRLLYSENTILEKGVNTLKFNLGAFNESLYSLKVKTESSLIVRTLMKVK